MKLLIDDAHVETIRSLLIHFPVDGVTTNPSILQAVGKAPFFVLKEIRELLGSTLELHVQVIAATAQEMEEDARRIAKELGRETYVKIPSTREGICAMRNLSREGFHITATAIYTPMQAYLAAKAGAWYAAPYVNRIDNLGANGVETAKTIHDIFLINRFDTQVLAASFKNTQQVLELCQYGVGAATLAPDILEGLLQHAAVDAAVDAFQKSFYSLVGEGMNLADLP